MRKALLTGLTTLFSFAALAQAPSVDPELLDRTLHRSDTQLRICIGETAYQRELEEDLATAIADALLLDTQIHYYPPLNYPAPYDYILGPTFEDMFILLTNECDVFMGMNLAGDPVGDWLLFSRPIYTTRFALVAPKDSGLEALRDLAPDQSIGTRLTSVGDLRLGTFLRTQPAQTKPRRFPYNDNVMLFDNLVRRQIDSALIWQPALTGLIDANPDAPVLREMSLGSFRTPEIAFGLAYLAGNVYLRTMIDEAIDLLVNDGTIDGIVHSHFPDASVD